MRAFAKFLGTSPAYLSMVLSKSVGMSKSMANKIAEKLNLAPNQKQFFCDSVEAHHGRIERIREAAEERLRAHKYDFEQIDEDTLNTLSKWEHFAILELLGVPKFNGDTAQIAQKLNLDAAEAHNALDRMSRLGFVKRRRDGTYKILKLMTSLPSPVPEPMLAGVRRMNRELTLKALESIEGQARPRREIASTIFSFERESLPKIKEELKQFRWRLCREYGTSGNPDSVYCLNMQLFDLLEEGNP